MAILTILGLVVNWLIFCSWHFTYYASNQNEPNWLELYSRLQFWLFCRNRFQVNVFVWFSFFTSLPAFSKAVTLLLNMWPVLPKGLRYFFCFFLHSFPTTQLYVWKRRKLPRKGVLWARDLLTWSCSSKVEKNAVNFTMMRVSVLSPRMTPFISDMWHFTFWSSCLIPALGLI